MPWIPDNAAEVKPPIRRILEGNDWYNWSPESSTGRWVLPRVLREIGNLHLYRTLVLVMDEGSPGWSLFNYLANHVRARVLFIRDPLHRLSNLFTNALRAAIPSVAHPQLQPLDRSVPREQSTGGREL